MNFFNKNKKAIVSTLTLVTIIGLGEISIASKPKNIELNIDGNRKTITTSAKTVEDVLKEQNIAIKNTEILNDLNSVVNLKTVITVNNKKSISFKNKGKNLTVSTFKNNVSDFLNEYGIKPDSDDNVVPKATSSIKNGDTVIFDDIQVLNYNKKESIKHKTETKYDFNRKYGEKIVNIKGYDGIKQNNFTKITINGKVVSDTKKSESIVLSPVTEKVTLGSKEILKEKVEFKTEKKSNSNMYEGETKVVQKGKNGLLENTYKHENKNKTLVSSKQLEKATNEIVEYGTKKKPSVSSTSYQYSLSQFQFNGVVYWGGYKFTYYSQSVLPGGGLYIPGRHVNESGYVADGDGYIVLANDAPKGTIINTPFGYKGKVYDRGTYGNHIDVYIR
ncbi:G5 domain-containing protein [Helcococcus bovis]|uniref:G5 domain-containing protein n=1 Tax=Helcococcus bovis TaxID=3153252 RepID=UPI0038B84F5C